MVVLFGMLFLNGTVASAMKRKVVSACKRKRRSKLWASVYLQRPALRQTSFRVGSIFAFAHDAVVDGGEGEY